MTMPRPSSWASRSGRAARDRPTGKPRSSRPHGDAECREPGDGPGDGQPDVRAIGFTARVDQRWRCVDGRVGDRVEPMVGHDLPPLALPSVPKLQGLGVPLRADGLAHLHPVAHLRGVEVAVGEQFVVDLQRLDLGDRVEDAVVLA